MIVSIAVAFTVATLVATGLLLMAHMVEDFRAA
jgi:putative copper export protein